MNRLFVVKKPMFISSNQYLTDIKKRYGVKKAGFSGTLDPFAKGCLIVAFGKYTKLFRYLKKTPKTYRTTIFLGAYSETLDIEGISKIENIPPFSIDRIVKVLDSFRGKISQIPPKYSAKKLNGKRAYELARKGENVEIKEIIVEIFDIKLTNYSHPFLSFEVVVSEGTYIRSLGRDIADRLGVFGSLTYLERISEGSFYFDNEKALDPIEYLDLEKNIYLLDKKDIYLGKKLSVNGFKNRKKGRYIVEFDNYFSIVEIDKDVKYLLNRVEKC